MIITIDGPIATGKSTIAKELARELGYIYFDTGAMYRCLTYGVLNHNILFERPDELAKFLDTFSFNIKIKQGEKHYFVENEDITLKIRGPEVTTAVSKISALKPVREKLVLIQRQFAEGVNAIFEGRDMGTVVFPNADIKVFLTGDPTVRAHRRFEELRGKFPEETKNLTLEQVLEEINQRDTYDTTREISPLKKADNAFVVDTSNRTVADIVFSILEYKDTIKTRQKFK